MMIVAFLIVAFIAAAMVVAMIVTFPTRFDHVDEAICYLYQQGIVDANEADRRASVNNAAARAFYWVRELYAADRRARK